MLLRKGQIQERANPAAKTSAALLLEKTRLIQTRNLAMKRNDRAEVAVLDKKLEELLATIAADPGSKPRDAEAADIMAKVNERNRKANQEAMRLAALADAERKRKERQAAMSGSGNVSIDPSARLKTVPRMFASRFVVFVCSTVCWISLTSSTPSSSSYLVGKEPRMSMAPLLLSPAHQALPLLMQLPALRLEVRLSNR